MRLAPLLATAILLAATASATEDPPPEGPGAPDDDPVVYWFEEFEPAAEAKDGWGGSPPWTWYEDPASVSCQDAPKWCDNEPAIATANGWTKAPEAEAK